MDTIKNYLETLFIEFPKTEEVERAKQELLTIMEDHYWSLRDEGKSEHEAIGAVISEFGSVDELKETLQFESRIEEEFEPEDDFNAITEDDMLEFMAKRKRSSFGLSLGISLCIISVASLVATQGVWYIGGLGAAVFFMIAAAGVGLIIMSGIELYNQGKPLNDRFVPREVQNLAKTEKEAYHKSFKASLVLGISSCVLSLVPVMIFFEYYYSALGVVLMFMMIAAGVFLIVYGSLYSSSYNKFINNRYYVHDDDKMGPNARRERYGNAAPTVLLIEKLYWPLIVCFYFFWSFLTNSWEISWLVFVLAAVFHDLLIGFFKKTYN